MQILAHRGSWRSKKEKNSFQAIARAAKMGFGVETDVRDSAGKLVIAHDPGSTRKPGAEKIFELFAGNTKDQTLAINVKADGLQDLVQRLARRHKVRKYFVFDASIPELIEYRARKIPFFTRQSEFEPWPVLWEHAAGIWLDSFKSDWFTANIIGEHLKAGKDVCVVSPELHGRGHASLWRILKQPRLRRYRQKLFLCTDFPDKAQRYFNGED